MDRITFRCPDPLKDGIEAYASEGGYANRTEFIRESLRKNTPNGYITGRDDA